MDDDSVLPRTLPSFTIDGQSVCVGLSSSEESPLFNNRSMRQIISQFANIYSLRCTVTNATKENSLKFSQRYRSVIQSIIVQLNSESRESKLDEGGNGLEMMTSDEELIGQLSVVDLVWSLSEALFFTKELDLFLFSAGLIAVH